MFIKCLSLDEMFWSESDQLLTMTCYLVFDIFGRFHDPPTMNRKYTQWSVLIISSLCFWTVANDDDDHCFQSTALKLIPMDMTGSESKQKEADGRKSTERNKISQNLPQGSSTPLTIIRWHIHHHWKHMTLNLLTSLFPVLCFWTKTQSWERSVSFMFACVKKYQVRLIYPQRKWRCYNDQLFLTGECVSYKTSPPLMERRTKIDISNSEIIKSDWKWNLH